MELNYYGKGPSGDFLPHPSTRTVPFTAGDGISEYIEVSRIAEFPRGADGTCAYCGGDPCAELPAEPRTQQIHDYYIRNRERMKHWGSVSCPCCEGRPT